MKVTKVQFDVPGPEIDPTYVLQVEVEGSEFLHRAMPILAYVGSVEVECIDVNAEGSNFAGLLRTLPPNGAVLTVGYLDTDLFDTGFTYPSPPA